MMNPSRFARTRCAALLLAGFLAACSSLHRAGEAGGEANLGHDYTFAFLQANEHAGELDEAATSAAIQGHRAHIEEMGANGTLLLAGPFGEPRAEDNWRGIFVFDVPESGVANALAREDPSVQAGVFDVTVVPWRSNISLRPLRDLIERDKADDLPFKPAAYVLAIGPNTKQTRDRLLHLGEGAAVICAGPLGGDREDQLLALLRTETVESAQAWLETNDLTAGWSLSSFWASARLGDTWNE